MDRTTSFFVPAAKLKEEQEASIVKQQEEARGISVVSLNIGGYIRRCWEAARNARNREITTVLRNCTLQRKGEYTPEKLQNIKAWGGTTIFMGITSVKCRAAEAWLKEILLSSGEKPWSLRPTPIPELPPPLIPLVEAKVRLELARLPELPEYENAFELYKKIQQDLKNELNEEAVNINRRMEIRVEDELGEGNWEKALKEVISDICTFPAGFMKGPIVRSRRCLEWYQDDSGNWATRIGKKLKREYERVSPYNIYPSPSSTHINDGFLIERIRLTKGDLVSMIGVPGFQEVAIRRALQEFDAGNIKEWLWVEGVGQEEIVHGTKTVTDSPEKPIDVLEYWGEIQGKFLLQWGIEPEKIPDPDIVYPTTAWLIGHDVIGARLNPQPLGEKPYYKSSFEEIPGHFWGKGPPQLMEDVQGVCNASARAIVNNVAIASGPQVSVDASKVQAGQDITSIYPWKIWVTENDDQPTRQAKPVEFFSPNSTTVELLAIFKTFSEEADNYTGVPPYTYGSAVNIGGAGRSLANYEKIVTPKGMVEIGLIKKGDLVCNSYGSFSKVTGVYPQGESDVFRVKFNNGEHVDCDMEHRWLVRTYAKGKFKILTTGEILDNGLFWKTIKGKKNPKGYMPKWMLPAVNSIEFEQRDVKIDPYTMGVLLGDGSSYGNSRCIVTSADQEIFDRIPYPLGKKQMQNGDKSWSHTVKGIVSDYHSYGLNCKSIEKFIPEDYLFNSKKVRLELLRGLADTDGTCTKLGGTIFYSSSYRLINDFKKLVKSLGAVTKGIYRIKSHKFKVKGRTVFSKESYRLTFNLPNEKIFHLKRKQERVRVRPKTHTYITGIEYIGKCKATCVTIDSKDKLFICENFIPTHNTASGLSMLMAAAAKGLKYVLSNIDDEVIKKSIAALYMQLMLYDPDQSIKGDLCVVARGALALVAKEQLQIRRTEFLRDLLRSPELVRIVGVRGISRLLRSTVNALEIPTDDIVPSEEKLDALEKRQHEIEEMAYREQLRKGDGLTGTQPEQTQGINAAPRPRELEASGDRMAGQELATIGDQVSR